MKSRLTFVLGCVTFAMVCLCGRIVYCLMQAMLLSCKALRTFFQENCKVALLEICHPERSEGSRWYGGTCTMPRRFFASLRMTFFWTLQFSWDVFPLDFLEAWCDETMVPSAP
jgi:hypothetical protein